MTIKKIRKKNKKSRLYFLGLVLTVISLFIYFIFDIKSNISRKVIRTKIADLGEIQKTIDKDIVIIRKNTPIVSGRDGVLTKFYRQGDRVPKDSVICKIQDSKESENEIAALTKINMRIEDIQNNSVSYSHDVESRRLQSDINYLYMDIQEKIKNNEYKSVANLKSELLVLIDKKNVVNGISEYDNADLQTLINKKKELESKLSSNNIYVRAAQSGTVSYYYDGYEDKFSFDNINKLSVKDIKSVSSNLKQTGEVSVKKGDLIGYIVDNHYYYMATEIEKSDIEAIRRDVKLSIIVGDITFNAYFYDFYKDDHGKFVGLFKVESEDYDFLKNRKDHVTIVYSHAKGLLIPNNAILDLDGKKGVYIVNEVGIVEFAVLGDILLSDEENTIVRFSYDDFNDSSKVNLYDEIILSPKGMKDGLRVR